jgi:hypothetical protein
MAAGGERTAVANGTVRQEAAALSGPAGGRRPRWVWAPVIMRFTGVAIAPASP